MRFDTHGFDLVQSCAGSFFCFTAGRSEHIGYSFAISLKPFRLPASAAAGLLSCVKGMSKLLSETTIKLDTELLRAATAVAEAEGVSRSEYIRDLIIVDIQKRRRKHALMNSVFGADCAFGNELSGISGGGDE